MSGIKCRLCDHEFPVLLSEDTHRNRNIIPDTEILAHTIGHYREMVAELRTMMRNSEDPLTNYAEVVFARKYKEWFA